MASWNKITTQEEYQAAQQRIDELIDVEHTDDMHNELLLLSFLVDEFEEAHYPIQGASPLRVLKFMMEMKGIKQKDLIPILGSKGHVSKILNGTAGIQLEMIAPLSKFLGIPKDTLIPDVARDEDPIGVIAEYADLTNEKDQDLEIGTPWQEESKPLTVAYDPETEMPAKPKKKVRS